MNRMDWFVLCPVPRDQRPFYEYIKRKDSSILGWVSLNESNYARRFFLSLTGIFSITLPLTSWFISIVYYPYQTILISTCVTLAIQTIIYGYFFITWFYAGKRLVAAKVWYEESGWYDGRIWIKPPSILRHERLLYHYQLVPLITRLTKTLQFLSLSMVFVISLLFLIVY
uniref:Conserved hypothetical plastid protein n=2 Tax=Microchloropsis salina TaxID=2511165 RepID=T1RJG9_9STRA|nr:conserved hypothetical plastid protein [Microchloropsis salina]AGI99201.1 conserved hypothetical plastid protein [Microchloropsis salina]